MRRTWPSPSFLLSLLSKLRLRPEIELGLPVLRDGHLSLPAVNAPSITERRAEMVS